MAAIRTQREIRQRAPWWLIALLALNFGLMTYDARDVATKQRKIRTMAQTVADPFERAGSGVGNWIGGFFGSFGELRRASTENHDEVLPTAASILLRRRPAREKHARLRRRPGWDRAGP